MPDESEKAAAGEVSPEGGQRIVPLRLQKFLARAGVASRRGSENLMTAGRVSVNGAVVTELGSKVDPRVDEVRVDGIVVTIGTDSVTLLLNKPTGCLTTMKDPQGRRCVASLIPAERYPGLYPIGRLDRDTTGALLFSTDGELGNGLMHPSHHVTKTYIAQVAGHPSEKDLDKLRAGLEIKVGEVWRMTAPAAVKLLETLPSNCNVDDSCLSPRPGTSLLRIRIHQGMKHQVKLMCGQVGHEVVALHRVAFGPIALDDLAAGEYRLLAADEVAALRDSIDASSPHRMHQG